MALSPHAPTPTLLALIAAHRLAWISFAQAEPETRADADRRQRNALLLILAEPCEVRADADAAHRHLLAVLAADKHGLGLGALRSPVETRIRFLHDALARPDSSSPIRLGDAASAALRALGWLGDVAAGLALIAGGGAAVAFATLL